MPTYDYKCDNPDCEKTIEADGSIVESIGDAKKVCECGGMFRKVFSVPGLIQVKGNQGNHWNNAINKYGHERHA